MRFQTLQPDSENFVLWAVSFDGVTAISAYTLPRDSEDLIRYQNMCHAPLLKKYLDAHFRYFLTRTGVNKDLVPAGGRLLDP